MSWAVDGGGLGPSIYELFGRVKAPPTCGHRSIPTQAACGLAVDRVGISLS